MTHQKSNQKNNFNKSIRNYIDKFFGYGNLDGKFWFVGLEEGDTSEGDELEKRIHNWTAMGSPPVSDVVAAHHNLSGRTFYPGYKTPGENQPTITPLVKLFLFLLGFSGTSQQLLKKAKHCQGYKFARNSRAFKKFNQYSTNHPEDAKYAGIYNDTALLEFYPLPCRNFNENTWPYADIFPDIDILKSRKRYRSYVNKNHIPNLFNKIETHQPRVVIFYGKEMQEIIEEHTGKMKESIIPDTEKPVYHIRKKETDLYLIHHTTSPGMNAEKLLCNLAKEIRANLDSNIVNRLKEKYDV